jgi:outer membrane immunogenic protein
LALASSLNAAVNQKGPIGGGQFGYNWQFSPLVVVGFEADIQGSAIRGSGSSNGGTSTESFAGSSSNQAAAACNVAAGSQNCASATNGTLALATFASTANSAEVLVAAFSNPALSASALESVTADVNWLGTVRGRLGYLVTPNFLLYATGGLAYGGG